MVTEIKFNLQDVLHYFDRTSASEIYKAFYPFIHNPRYADREEISYPLCVLSLKLLKRVDELSDKVSGNSSSRLPDDFDSRAVSTRPYKQAVDRVCQMVGDEVKPYLDEFTLLAEYNRTSHVTLLIVNSLCTAGMPASIKEKIHTEKNLFKDIPREKNDLRQEYFNNFIHWLEKHPENNNFARSQGLSDLTIKLYQRIEALSEFYNSGKAVQQEDILHWRENFCNSLNATFVP